jgi:glutathione S-transferase
MLVLYHHGSSVCAAKVRLALAEKNLPWQGRYVDILKGEQFTPEFRRLNPKALVPVLVDDGRVITESTVINEYLEERFPEPTIFPRDPYLRARMRIWTKAVDEYLHPACAALTFITSHRHTVARLGPEKVKEFLDNTPVVSLALQWKEQKRHYVERGFDAPGAAEMIRMYDHYMQKMDEELKEGGPWLLGSQFTAADIALIPYVNRLEMLGLSGLWEHGRLPHLAAWWQRVIARPSFKPQVLDQIPPDLTNDLRTFGPRSWPEVRRIVGIAA